MPQVRLPAIRAAWMPDGRYDLTPNPNAVLFKGPGDITLSSRSAASSYGSDGYVRIGFDYAGVSATVNIAKKRITGERVYLFAKSAEYTNTGGNEGDWVPWTAFYPGALGQAWDEETITKEIMLQGGGSQSSNPHPSSGSWTSYAMGASTELPIYGFHIVVRSAKRRSTVVFAGYGSANAPYLLLDYENIIPEALQPSPAGGYVDPRLSKRLTWLFSAADGAIESPVQASATVEWREVVDGTPGATVNTIRVNSGNQYVDVPAYTFPAQSAVEWRVRVRSDDSIDSAWSPWCRLSTIEMAAASVAIAPTGLLLDKNTDRDFVWRHASPSGTKQSRAVLEYSYDGGATWTVFADIESAAQSYTLPGGTLPPGDMMWRVTTYNASGEAGDPGAPLSNTVISSPDRPFISPVDTTRARPLISWQTTAADQVTYEVQIVKDGVVIETSGHVADVAREYQAVTYLANETYTARVRIANEYAYWSQWAEYTFTVAAHKPTLPDIGAAPLRNAVNITLGALPEGIAKIIVYRVQDGKQTPIGVITPPATGFTDHMAAGTADYFARCIDAADNFADTPTVRATPAIRGNVICLMSSPADTIDLYWRIGSRPARGRSLDVGATLTQYEGRRLPVAEYGEGERRQYTATATIRGRADYLCLERMIAAKQTLVLRNQFGDRDYVSVAGLSTPHDGGQVRREFYDVDLTCVVVDADDAVEV